MMIKQEINDYVESLLPKRSAFLSEMEEFAVREQVPIMELVAIEAMLLQLKMKQPSAILEIGTAIGYSAIRMAEALPSAHITTIERDEIRYRQAVAYVKRAGLSDRITLMQGDANESVDLVVHLKPFDVLFIDAAKGQYKSFFEKYTPMLSEGGLVLSDNILFRGLVAADNDTIEPKRLRKLVEKIKGYNTWLCQHPSFETRILPIGDGLACSIKREQAGSTGVENK